MDVPRFDATARAERAERADAARNRQRVLKAAGMAVDGSALLVFFRQQTLTGSLEDKKVE